MNTNDFMESGLLWFQGPLNRPKRNIQCYACMDVLKTIPFGGFHLIRTISFPRPWMHSCLLWDRKAYRHCGMYMGTHKNGPICPNFPPSLLATSDAECRNPRNLDGLDLFFRYQFCHSLILSLTCVREVRGPQTNFRVSLKVAGRALLEHMAVNLGMQEMASLYKIEKKKDLCTEPLCQPVGRT